MCLVFDRKLLDLIVISFAKIFVLKGNGAKNYRCLFLVGCGWQSRGVSLLNDNLITHQNLATSLFWWAFLVTLINSQVLPYNIQKHEWKRKKEIFVGSLGCSLCLPLRRWIIVITQGWLFPFSSEKIAAQRRRKAMKNVTANCRKRAKLAPPVMRIYFAMYWAFIYDGILRACCENGCAEC